MKYKYIFLLFLVAIFCGDMKGATPSTLIVTMTDGTQSEISLTEYPIVTLSDTEMKISNGKTAIELPLDRVQRYTFGQSSGLQSVGIDGGNVIQESDRVLLTSVDKALRASVYDVKGIMVAKTDVGKGERGELSLKSLTPGVYILVVNGQKSLKILRQ